VELKLSGSQIRVFAEALQQAWQKELGVTVAIASEEQKTLFSDGSTGNFQVMETGYFYGINAPETILLVVRGDSPQNYSGWKDPAYESAYERASEAGTEAEQRAAFDELERILFLQAPLVPLYYVNQPFLVSNQVRGWRDNSIGQIDWRELWLGP
jgi:oligopeptide transport system substrate-binding protein